MAITRVSGDLIGQNTVTNQNIAASVQDAYGWRNRIINGDMRISQRGTSAVTASGAFPVDRFLHSFTGGEVDISSQQDSSAPTGFVNSTKITITTAEASVGADDRVAFQHRIEGTNVADLAWGTANAQAITLSFWVRSSVTGTFGGVLRNSANDRAYPFTYSISAANTWEQKSVAIPGDTTGTWLTTTGIGIVVNFSLMAGTNFAGTAGAWASSGVQGATGQVQLATTLNATWFITGVQLEAGSVATAFERRDFGRELAMCQRYFTSFTKSDSGNAGIASGFQAATTNAVYNIIFPVQMRVKPTATASLLISSDQVSFGAAATIGNLSASPSSTNLVTNYSANGALFRPSSLFIQPNGFLAFSAEL